MCVVWAPRVVTRSEPMDKFGECSEPVGVEQVDPAYLRKQPLPALLRVPSVVARNLVPTAA